MGPTELQPYAGPERRAYPHRVPPDGVVAFARFWDLPDVYGRFPDHRPGRWYQVRSWNDEAENPVSSPDYVWLDMGTIRGVPREHLEIRRDLRQARSSRED